MSDELELARELIQKADAAAYRQHSGSTGTPWIVWFEGCTDPAAPKCVFKVDFKLGHIGDAEFIRATTPDAVACLARAYLELAEQNT